MINIGTLRPLADHETSAGEAVGQRQFAGLQLSPEQEKVRTEVALRIADKQPRTIFGGYAGTGKSTTLGVIAQDFASKGIQVAYAAPTGKAASVLRRSLGANGVPPGFCGTIHRLIYRPVVNADGSITGWEKADKLACQAIVVDEASMVTKKLADDLASYGIPILYVGDHGQLPPVGEDVGLMAETDLRLETVRRQALTNPIVALSFLIRAGGDWKRYFNEKQGDVLRRVKPTDYMDYCMGLFEGFQNKPMSEDPLIIARTNEQRVALNAAVRIGLNTDKTLVEGERVICLKNAYLNGAFMANGFRGRVSKLNYERNRHMIGANVAFPDEMLALENGRLCSHQFGRSQTFKSLEDVPGGPGIWEEAGCLFDYGYALTCHKAQGSQADHVVVLVDRGRMDEAEWARWLYTAVTRAQNKLSMIF